MSTTVETNPETPDPSGVCHLLRIAPELRLMIIEPLLSLDENDPDKPIYPQVLRTCHQIHNECQPTLDKTILATIISKEDRSKGESTHFGFGGPRKTTRKLYTSCFSQELMAFSKFPRHCSEVLIDVSLSSPDLLDEELHGRFQARLGTAVRYCITLLAAHIARSNARKTHVRLNFDEMQYSSSVPSMLDWMFHPLKDVRPILQVSFSGLPEQQNTDFQTLWETIDPSIPTKGLVLSDYLSLEDKANELITLCAKANLEKTGVQFLPKLIRACLPKCYISPEYGEDRAEYQLEKAIGSATRMLQCEKWAGLRQQAKEILRQREVESSNTET